MSDRTLEPILDEQRGMRAEMRAMRVEISSGFQMIGSIANVRLNDLEARVAALERLVAQLKYGKN